MSASPGKSTTGARGFYSVSSAALLYVCAYMVLIFPNRAWAHIWFCRNNKRAKQTFISVTMRMCCLRRTKWKDPGFKFECKNRRRLHDDIAGLPTMTSNEPSEISDHPLLLLFAWCRTEIHTKGETVRIHTFKILEQKPSALSFNWSSCDRGHAV